MRVLALHTDLIVFISAFWQTTCTARALRRGGLRDRLAGASRTSSRRLRRCSSRRAFRSPGCSPRTPTGTTCSGASRSPTRRSAAARARRARLAAEPRAAQRELREFDEEHYVEGRRALALAGSSTLPVPGHLALGARHELELHPADGHTADGTAYLIPWLGVLVCGDYLSPVEIPWISPGGSASAYLATLERLRRCSPGRARSCRVTAARSTATARRACSRRMPPTSRRCAAEARRAPDPAGEAPRSADPRRERASGSRRDRGLDRDQPRDVGRARADPRRERVLRRRGLPGRALGAARVRARRAGRRARALARAPAVPLRARHPVLGPPRRPRHRARLLRPGDRRCPRDRGRAGIEAEFVEGNVYDAATVLGGRRFDIVYTGLGAIIWLADIERWAQTIGGAARARGAPVPGRVPPLDRRVRRRLAGRRAPVLRARSTDLRRAGDLRRPRCPDRAQPVGRVGARPRRRDLRAVPPPACASSSCTSTITRCSRAGRSCAATPTARYRLPDEMPSLPLMYSLLATRRRRS